MKRKLSILKYSFRDLLCMSSKSNQGFTLVEVLVGVAIIGGLSMSLMRILENQNLSQKKLAQNFTVLQVAEEVTYALKDAVSCKENFIGRKIDEGPNQDEDSNDQIAFFSFNEDEVNASGNLGAIEEFSVVKIGQKFGVGSQGSVVTEDIKLIHVPDDTGVEDFDEPNRLLIVFNKSSKSYGGKKIHFKIPIRVNIDPVTKAVTSCIADENDTLRNICLNMMKGYFNEEDQSCRSVSFMSQKDGLAVDAIDPTPAEANDFALKIKGKLQIKGDLLLGRVGVNNHHILFDSETKTLEATNKVKIGKLILSAGCDQSGLNCNEPSITGAHTIVADTINTEEIKARAIWFSSDRKLKKNIEDISTETINSLLDLEGVSYFWKESKFNKKQYGFIAQEVEKVFPEIVKTNRETGLKSISYTSLIAPILELVKQQEKDLKALELELDKLAKK